MNKIVVSLNIIIGILFVGFVVYNYVVGPESINPILWLLLDAIVAVLLFTSAYIISKK